MTPTKNNTTQHTPGPCHIGLNPGPFIYGPKGEQIADLTANLLDHDENMSNACRLAHCWNCHDDLLEACQFALESGDEVEALRKMKAAILKATGGQS